MSLFPQAQAEQDTSSTKKTQKEKGGQKVKEKAKKAPPPAPAVPGSTDSPPEIMEVNTFVLHSTDMLIYYPVNISTTVFSYSCAVQYHTILHRCYCTGPVETRYPGNHDVL